MKKLVSYCVLCLLAGSFLTYGQQSPNQVNKDEIERKVDSLLGLMTLVEKVGQMNQYNGFWDVTGPTPDEGDAAKKYEHLRSGLVGSMLNVQGTEEVRKVQKIAVEESRLGIPLIIAFDVIHGYKTISPIPLAEAASWDLEAIRKSAGVAAQEAAASGINWTFAPMVDISRDARWGRVMEGAGEDPFLGAKIGYARVKGFQGDDLSEVNTVAACAKHFAGYGFSEAGRDYNTVDVGTSTLHNIIFPPFKAAIEADVKTFMNSFNELNGIPATGNRFLQRDVLKQAWNYQGFVVSDWGSLSEMISHGYARDGKQAAMLAANAGSDMDMESYLYVKHLEDLVKEGKVDEALIDDSVRRILRVKYELGLMDDPYRYCDPEREKTVIGSQGNQDLVLDMAKKSIVLLKNETDLLPLKKNGMKIAVIGALADDKDSPLGSWRLAADANTAVSVLEGLNSYKGNEITYAKGVDLITEEASFIMETKINTTDRSGIEEAVEAAKGKDVVLMVLGEHGFQSGEGRSRASLDLPGLQQELLEAVYKVNKNIVLLLMNGRPLTINWAAENVPTILEVWHLGTQSGNAIAQVLYGDYNPSGKLPMTFPRSVGQVPIYYNFKNTGRPTIPAPDLVFWSHYIDESNDPLYEFGYGLSYTDFEYSNLRLSESSFSGDGSITVSFTLKNTGSYAGTEVAQMYIRDLFGSVTRPVRELKGFELVSLQPGESKTVNFKIDRELISYYTANDRWEAEPGEFKVFIGGSSNATMEIGFTYE
ncbi:beta-glucosidase BglX [Zeaxanthinibacter enoshimensis]|uniref:beta-glucosidase n=1 Tax=Zeaxanthinibacter enoshimensis TaxID=392009 RepID=A0A4R6TLV3_9FLAO|nr:beta-glucosidase BglX [Zeaxanthinibacter enoshimensis]TDQ29141.1 beta-glucosidase [Zeaxanthinibacter enoshimensis]